MKWTSALLLNATAALLLGADGSNNSSSAAKYSQDFSNSQPGEPPADIMILDGLFTVRDEGGNRFLELPGAPLERYGVLFGPSTAAGFQAQARVWGKREGRKFPVFSLGLNGQGGVKLRLSPAKQAVELVEGVDGDVVLATAPFQWKSGEWTALRLQVRTTGPGLTIEAKAWQGDQEPEKWLLKHDRPMPLPAGQAGVWGFPLNGTVLRFDDLKLVPAT